MVLIMTQEINVFCLGEGLINCLDMLSARDLKTCREVSQVFRQAVEETNQRRLAECRDNSPLCSELQTRMREHCFQEFHKDISPTALYWHTFHWMQTFVKRDNVLFIHKAHDHVIENASGHQSLMALSSIASVQQTVNEQVLVNWLKRFVRDNYTCDCDDLPILEQVNQQTTSLDIIRLFTHGTDDVYTRPSYFVRNALKMILETRNRPCLLEILKFNGLNQLLNNEKSLFELACTVGCRELIDLSLESTDMNFDCGYALRCLGGTKITRFEKGLSSLTRFEKVISSLNYEEFQNETISRLGGHLDSLRAFINSHYFQRASLEDIATSFDHALVLSHSTCASMIFCTNRFLSVPKDLYLRPFGPSSACVSNLFTALRVTGQINHLSRDHSQLLHELASKFNISIKEPVTERIPDISICMPMAALVTALCFSILSIGVMMCIDDF